MDKQFYEDIEAKIPRGGFRTRFAPSPTGFLHLGVLRTALYAYLLAKKAGGTLILRIEDTDRERLVEGAAEYIYETLVAVDIKYDEGPDVGGPVGPYVQSERREIYGAYAKRLVESGHAYYCFCDKETLDEQRLIHEASRILHKYDRSCAALSPEEIAAKLDANTPHVIRQKVPDGKTFFNDAVYGRIEVENSTLEDQVILKSDGLPTYNFANVVDDRLMGVTHVIRGNEFLSSTPKHVLLYKGFGWDTPEYIHVPQIMRNATKKLSKRDGDAYFGDFIEKGYLKEAIINYIALLGWSPGGEEEKFSLAELAEVFDISGISKSPAIFDYQKLNWLNGAYLRAMSEDDYHAAALPHIKKAVTRNDIDTQQIAALLQGRIELLSEIPVQIDFIDAVVPHELDLYENKKMKIDATGAKAVLPEVYATLEKITAWDKDTIQTEISALVSRLELKNGQVLWPMRIALTGKTFGPGGSVDFCAIFGKDETLARLAAAIERLVQI